MKEELSGILAWAVRGCLAWQKDGLGIPEEVRSATASYHEETDVLRDFLANCCVIGEKKLVTTKALWEAYAEWCEVNGENLLVSVLSECV